ncbi:hypothetical protein BC835DRAFT_1422497 [Cytidiella melzeri]|nr:hypothetical protein BC835DRAFT_1422497 [Cytidiella melzeri]
MFCSIKVSFKEPKESARPSTPPPKVRAPKRQHDVTYYYYDNVPVPVNATWIHYQPRPSPPPQRWIVPAIQYATPVPVVPAWYYPSPPTHWLYQTY